MPPGRPDAVGKGSLPAPLTPVIAVIDLPEPATKSASLHNTQAAEDLLSPPVPGITPR